MILLQEQVASAIRERRLFRPGQKILVAASGGVDSMVLLRLLHEISRGTGWKITVAHLNHQLRGNSSKADERLVCREAKSLDLPSVIARADVLSFARDHGISIEMAARRHRHDFLARTAKARGISCIAMAHHADDQVELFFLRLFRGGGSRGLAGMKWSNSSPADRRIKLIRPLLDCRKQDLLAYAAATKVRFREDSTNASVDIQRNRIRHELLPLLRRKYQGALDATVRRTMDILAAETEFVIAAAESWLGAGIGPRASSIPQNWSEADFERLPLGVQRCCLQLQLERLGVPPDFALVEHLREHPNRPIQVKCEPMGDRFLEKSQIGLIRLAAEGGRVRLMRPKTPPSFQAGLVNLDLARAGGRDWHKVRIDWRVGRIHGQKVPGRVPGTEHFDADKVGSKAVIRHWRPGDRFQPIGMEQSVKLQDLFVNQKVPLATRRRLVVAATTRGELFWVEGLRISEQFKLTGATIRRLQWRCQRH